MKMKSLEPCGLKVFMLKLRSMIILEMRIVMFMILLSIMLLIFLNFISMTMMINLFKTHFKISINIKFVESKMFIKETGSYLMLKQCINMKNI